MSKNYSNNYYCVPIVGPTLREASQQIEQGSLVASLLEFRLDLFHDYELTALRELREKIKLPIIFTLRKKEEASLKELEEWQQKIVELATLEPDYLDIEYESASDFPLQCTKNFPSIKLILSYHNYHCTPPNLPSLLQDMQKQPAYLYKIACTACSTTDSLRMLDLLQTHPPLLGMCMGEKGEITRILAPRLGSPWIYTYIDQKTAPGQLSVEELNSIYALPALPSCFSVYGLIGSCVKNSPSHRTHNQTLRHLKKAALYVKMAVEVEELEEFFLWAKKLGIFAGLSVTMPLKEAVLPFLDEVDPEAQKIGAVNTLLFQKGKLLGYNTDGKGALDAIEKKTSVRDKKITLLGAGGACRALLYEAQKRGAKVRLLNRTPAKALLVASLFQIEGGGLDLVEKGNYDILVNTTPSSLPIPASALAREKLVMDIKTIPKMTLFLQEAATKNCILIFGYEMFINQAARQFELWFPDIDRTLSHHYLQEAIAPMLLNS